MGRHCRRTQRQGKRERMRLKMGRASGGFQCSACRKRHEDSGEHTEILACRALRALVEKKVTLANNQKSAHVTVVTYLHVFPNSFFDGAGKLDFLILLSNQLAIALQVKSSRGGMTFHGNRYPHIPSVQLSLKMGVDAVGKEIQKFLSSLLRGLPAS